MSNITDVEMSDLGWYENHIDEGDVELLEAAGVPAALKRQSTAIRRHLKDNYKSMNIADLDTRLILIENINYRLGRIETLRELKTKQS